MAEFKELTDLGSYFLKKREETKLSMDVISKRSQISKAYLSRIERNMNIPSSKKIEQLVKVYNISPEEEIAIYKYCRNFKIKKREEANNAMPSAEERIFVLEGEGLTEEDLIEIKELIKKKKAERANQKKK